MDFNKVAFGATLVAALLALTWLGPIASAKDLNVTHEESAAEIEELNQPPTISMPANISIYHGHSYIFTANASDPDGDPMRFTWYWGDGRSTVTASPSATHMYNIGTYMLQVYADDLTGLEGHNVSATTWVMAHCITPPAAVTVAVILQTFYYVDQVLTFTGSAQDASGEPMQFEFFFGDGASTIVNNCATAPNAVVTNSATHVFAAAGTYGYYMSATDGLSTTSSSVCPITVYLNHTPTMVPQTLKKANQGVTISFAATATDLDGDPLRYTWNFGDGSALVVSRTTTHRYVNPGYYNFTAYVDDLTGIPGHNISSTAMASIAFNLTLVAGWNFESIPMMGYGYKASTLGLSTGDMILPWDYYFRNHYAYIKGITPESYDFAILPGHGYWVWVGASRALHLFGYVPLENQTIDLDIPAGVGWFPVGLNSLKTWHASDIPGMYSNPGTVTMVVLHEESQKTYRTWLAGVPSLNDFLIMPGTAFWIWTSAPGGILSYAP